MSGPASFWPVALPYARQASSATGVDVAVILSQWFDEVWDPDTDSPGPDWTVYHNPGNVDDPVSGGQVTFSDLEDGTLAYIDVMLQPDYDAVRAAVGDDAQAVALGESPWASSHYELPGDGPGSALIDILDTYDLAQFNPLPPAPPEVIMKPLTGRYGVLNAPVVAVLPTPAGDGYHLVAADGGTFDYNCPYIGSLADLELDAPIVDAALTSTGLGILMIGTDGGAFALGDAPFDGSEGGKALNAPVVSVALTPTDKGYWMTAADGGVFAFGDAPFEGSPA